MAQALMGWAFWPVASGEFRGSGGPTTALLQPKSPNQRPEGVRHGGSEGGGLTREAPVSDTGSGRSTSVGSARARTALAQAGGIPTGA
jgi:hypothetical protein